MFPIEYKVLGLYTLEITLSSHQDAYSKDRLYTNEF
jgi:hypothetical protein